MRRLGVLAVCGVLGGGVWVWGCDTGDRGLTAVEGPPSQAERSPERDGPDEIEWRIIDGHKQAGTGRLELTVDIDGERHAFTMGRAAQGVEFELIDQRDDRFGLALGHDGTGLMISEWTNTDRLDIAIEKLLGDRVRETYELNGVSRAWVVPDDEEVPNSVAKEFKSFMPETNSLNVSAVGQRLVALITDPDLPGELDRLGFADLDALSSGSQRVPDSMLAACVAVAACTGVKCPIGGPGNPVCSLCAGATFLCVLVILSYYL